MECLARMVITHNKAILVATLSLANLLTVSAAQNRLNDKRINYFTENVPVRVATDVLEQRISGADYLEYDIRTGRPQGINNPEFLNHLDGFVQWLRTHPQVEQVVAITDVMNKIEPCYACR